MTGEQAGNILALLVAAYPDTALDNESSSFFVSEIARLADYEAALETARLCAREARKFPSLAEFRQTYRSIAKARKPPLSLDAGKPFKENLGPRELPDEARALLGRLTVKDIAPPKLPSVEDGVCDDCKSAGERVSYGKKKVCEACARSRAVAAVQVEAWRYQAEADDTKKVSMDHGCERHHGEPHNLCEACWAVEPTRAADSRPGHMDRPYGV